MRDSNLSLMGIPLECTVSLKLFYDIIQIAAKYEKENFDLKHQNRKVKDEIVTRSPMK